MMKIIQKRVFTNYFAQCSTKSQDVSLEYSTTRRGTSCGATIRRTKRQCRMPMASSSAAFDTVWVLLANIIKSKVYRTRPLSIGDIKIHIREAFDQIDGDMLKRSLFLCKINGKTVIFLYISFLSFRIVYKK